MKIFSTLLFLFSFKVLASELVTFQEFQKMPLTKKVEILEAYRIFLHEYQKNEIPLGTLTYQNDFAFIQEAYAAQKFNCFYAGWPSYQKSYVKDGKTRTYCSSPARSNPQYKEMAKKCKKDFLLCQPAMFGEGFCVSTKTRAERNSAYSQCQRKFIASGRSLEKLAKDLTNSDLSSLADEVFSLVHDICTVGTFQSKTGMCMGLKSRVASIKGHIKSVPAPKEVKPLKKITVTDQGKIVEDKKLQERLIETIKKIESAGIITEQINPIVSCDFCELRKKIEAIDEVRAPYEASEAIDQSKTTAKDFCSGNQKGHNRELYQNTVHFDLKNSLSIHATYQEAEGRKTSGGFSISAGQLGRSFPFVEEGEVIPMEEMGLTSPKRLFSYDYFGRGKENVFEIMDFPVKEIYRNKKVKERFQSTDVRFTQYYFFPRKNVPSIKKRGDKIIVKLTTGEEMILDAESGRTIAGVGKETTALNPIVSKGNNRYIYPTTDFTYGGEGLFIEFKDGKFKPNMMLPIKALVEGRWQECKLRAGDLFVEDYGYYLPKDHKDYLSSYWSCSRFKFEKDQELYEMVKKECPGFKFPPLTK